ncbi:Plasmid stabilization system protein [Gimesia panareensis]|uniref:Plasmid stabilization system protein n=1 Tax=Gimesia panareensis TaxID=2527978 RepID=A0A518FYX2_9PLAN|nr:type II toxin-antitoxin system RelE/ParE family toxin [Gimesia panareensis]QDV21470.1 Plasmid stabilization system protein [Gimesia panareensis]
MSYQVELSRQAETDIRKIYTYIREHGPADPKAWKKGLASKLAHLEQFPEACSLALENDFTPQEIRQTFYGPFRILFTIREPFVFVATVRHAARLELKPDELDKLL